MSAPTWEEYMAPAIRVLADGEVHRARQIVESAADLLGVSAEDRQVLIPSGQERYRNRGLWALSYLSRVGAIDRPTRGNYRVTDIGRKLLEDHPDGITEKNLRALSGDPNAPHTFKAFPLAERPATPVVAASDPELDPEEQIASGVARINSDVAEQLLTRILEQEPVFFEQAVLDLLMAMGYGGAEGTASRTKLSRDGGIDGIIDQDALGLSRIYVQAKRYALDHAVGREAIQGFVGALAGNQASQGVFITTSRFASTALAYADSVSARVILIDGERLTRLMIRYGVGVQVKQRFEVVEIDEDFFESPPPISRPITHRLACAHGHPTGAGGGGPEPVAARPCRGGLSAQPFRLRERSARTEPGCARTPSACPRDAAVTAGAAAPRRRPPHRGGAPCPRAAALWLGRPRR